GICVFIQVRGVDGSVKWVGRFRAYEIAAGSGESFHVLADPLLEEPFQKNRLHERFVALRAMALLGRGMPLNRLLSAPGEDAEKVFGLGFQEVLTAELGRCPLALVEVAKFSRREKPDLQTGLMQLDVTS